MRPSCEHMPSERELERLYDEHAPALFAFHRGPHGMRVELVDRANQPHFDGWLSGSALTLPSSQGTS